MSDSPISRLLDICDAPNKPEDYEAWRAIERFEDLVLEMPVEVWHEAFKEWRSGVVRTIGAGSRGQVVARVRTTRGSYFFHADRWSERDRRRIRRVEFAMVPATERQAAKAMNFGTPNHVPPIDGMSPQCIFDLYLKIQREDMGPIDLVTMKPRLTTRQLEVARMMWSAFVRTKVKASEREDVRRERERVVVDYLED